MCARGEGATRDPEAAFAWYMKSANAHGSQDAYNAIAYAYFDGTGVAKDYGAAFEWIGTAWRQAGPDAQSDILIKITFLNHALDVLKPGAASGDPEAQYCLGEIYSDTDVRDEELWSHHDLDTAYQWFAKSAAGNYGPAMMKLGDRHALRSTATRSSGT
jgi:TPR repeat protein